MPRTYLTLPNVIDSSLPSRFRFNDVRYTEELVSHFIGMYTQPGDLVFDPFTGFGTTLFVAKKMDRQVFGVEIHEDRVEFIKRQGIDEISLGDIRKVDMRDFPTIDFLMTSPPFMGREDTADALTGYQYRGTYADYLETMRQIFLRLQQKMRPGATLVIEISNLKQDTSITTLAWDVGGILSEIYTFQGEVVICWENDQSEEVAYGYGYDHSYCLVYKYLSEDIIEKEEQTT